MNFICKGSKIENVVVHWCLGVGLVIFLVFGTSSRWVLNAPNELTIKTTEKPWSKMMEESNLSSFSISQMTKRMPSRVVSCMPETFVKPSWNQNPVSASTIDSQVLLQSCLYKLLCYDVLQRSLFLFPSVHHYQVLIRLHSSIFLSSLSKPVIMSPISNDIISINQNLTAIKPIYRKFRSNDNYFIIQEDECNNDKDDSVWIPIQLLNSSRSILWDIYFPIYSLLEMFDLTSKKFHILLLPSDDNSINVTLQKEQIHHFSDSMQLPRLNILSLSFVTGTKIEQNTNEYLCFPHAAMGVGGLGYYSHNQLRYNTKNGTSDSNKEFKIPPHHIRRRKGIHKFRGYLLDQMNFSSLRTVPYDSIRLVHSSYISRKAILLTGSFYSKSDSTRISIQELSPGIVGSERVRIILQTNILLLTSEEDKTLALFLPPKAHLVFIGTPPNKDWDFWTNCVWIQIHHVRKYVAQAVEYIVSEVLYFFDASQVDVNTTSNKESPMFWTKNHDLDHSPFVSLINAPPPATKIHCITEKLFPNNEGVKNFRSCHLENICFDLKQKDFVIFPSPAYHQLITKKKRLMRDNYFSTVSLPLVMSPQMKFAREVKYASLRIHNSTVDESKSEISRFYKLRGTWIIINSVNACNPGQS
jgi:hypothetical protein